MLTVLRRLEDKRLEYLLVILVFLAFTLIFFWPLPAHLTDGILVDPGDPVLNTKLIAWDADVLFRSPSNIWQINFFYPSRDVLTYSEHLLTLGVLGAPFYHLTANPSLTYNLLLILGYAFSGFACYLLVKYLTGSRWGALAGGLFFAFAPYKMAQASHIHISFSPFLPLMLLFLFKYMDTGSRRDIILGGLFFLLQAFIGWHYALFCVILFAIFWSFKAISHRGEHKWRRLASLALLLVILALFLLIPALPYVRVRNRMHNFGWSIEQMAYYSAHPKDFLRAHPYNLLYGKLLGLGSAPLYSCEWTLFPGIAIAILALFSLTRIRKKPDFDDLHSGAAGAGNLLLFTIIAILGLIYILGPKIGGVSNPLYYLTFLGNRLNFIRVPTRFYIMVVLGISVLAGYGFSFLLQGIARKLKEPRRFRAHAAAITILIVAELFTIGIPVFSAPTHESLEPVYRWLEDQEDCVIAELPTLPIEQVYLPNSEDISFSPADLLPYFFRECGIMLRSSYHNKTTVNGHSGYSPFFYNRIMPEIQAFPSRRSIELLGGLHVDYVIWHWEWVEEDRIEWYKEELASADGITLVEDFGEQAVYRILPQETAAPKDIEMELVLPRRIPAGEDFNLGFLVHNISSKPYVLAIEDRQPFKLTVQDSQGRLVQETEGFFRAPFFLQEGEWASVVFQAKNAPAPGDYQLELRLEEGIFSPRAFRSHISVGQQREIIGSGLVAGEVHFDPQIDRLAVPHTDGLFPLVVEAANTGENQWKCKWAADKAEDCPYGMVWVGVAFYKEGQQVGESCAQALPCDLSAGQSVPVTILIRPPGEPGEYQLVAWLLDFLHGNFSRLSKIDVEVREE